MNANNAAVLIIGVGNPLRRDDGAGPAAIVWLQQQHLSPTIEILPHHGEGLSLMDAWRGYGHVVLIDATYSNVPAGTIQRFDAIETALPKSLFHYSSHLFGVAEAVGLARALGRLPQALTVYGIEGVDFTYGDQLSPAVAAAVAIVGNELARTYAR